MSESSGSIEVVFDVPVPMRDGVVLAADVYSPSAAPAPLPVLLLRTPYGKHTVPETAWTGIDPVAVARSGFVVVVQDTRGRFASGGEWEPLHHEASDGADSVEWAAALPGSNGRVGLFGGSYSGSTAWQAALAQPSGLAAMSVLMTWADPRDGLYSRGGALELGLDLPWSLVTGIDDVVRRFGEDASLVTRVEAMLDEFDQLRDVGFWSPPAGVLGRHEVRDIGSLAAAGAPASPDPADLSGRQPLAGVPTLHSAGWFDIFLQGTLDNHQAMVAAGLESTLVVGPWSHENFGNVQGELDLGIRAARDSPAVVPDGGSWAEAQLSWLRGQLDPEDGQEPPLPAVRIFVMGRNEWRSEPAWPPAEARDVELFLHPDGSLSRDEPVGSATPMTYTYDLADPVPTVGGNTFITPAHPAGPMDQRAIETRPDVLTFTSEVLTEDLEVTGRVLAHLVVASSAPTADWVVRLCDVHPDGRSFNVCDGVARVASGQSHHRHTVDLWSTSMVFLAGHRIRVQVTNSSFPRWDRAPAATGDAAHVPHEARVVSDREQPSTIVLPVMPARTGDMP